MLKRFRPAWAVVAWLIISTWPLPSNATLEDANAAIAAADYQRAYSKLVSLAETGNARAQRMLGGLHLTGLGTAKDPISTGLVLADAASFATYSTTHFGNGPPPGTIRKDASPPS